MITNPPQDGRQGSKRIWMLLIRFPSTAADKTSQTHCYDVLSKIMKNMRQIKLIKPDSTSSLSTSLTISRPIKKTTQRQTTDDCNVLFENLIRMSGIDDFQRSYDWPTPLGSPA